jgi:solute:Na+ symporter, SSS family
MHWIDWLIVIVLVGFITITAYQTKRYMLSVADFLSANRCAGKYLLGVADGIAGLGAISIVARFELHYKAGFTGSWWDMMFLGIGVIVAATGWVQYRFRQTRAMTMAQFFEMRYSRRFRIYAGVMGCVSGIINFGIFPAVGGRFFQYYCGFHAYPVSLLGAEIDLVYAAIMVVLLAVSLAFTFMGGQIAVMVTDFLQGIFVNVVFALLGFFLLFYLFDWSQIMEAAALAPPDASLINPLKTGGTDNFNVSYFLIQAFGAVYVFMAWQGNQGYYGAARSPHDARMGRVIGGLRPITQTLPLVLLPMAAWTFLHHPDFASQAAGALDTLNAIESEQIRSQLTVTVGIGTLLPAGIMGLFAAVMLSAFISTHDTYLHAWGSIFIQDVVMPVRQNLMGDESVLKPQSHIRLLKWSISGVCLFIFLFSLLFSQQQDILMFFALTGTIYLGWAGAAIIGGLYWKRGTTAGAWWAAIMGVVLAILGWSFTYFWTDAQACFSGLAPGLWESCGQRWPGLLGDSIPVNAQILWFWTMIATLVTYVAVSLISGIGREPYNMDRMLHRGQYALEGTAAPEAKAKRGWAIFGMGEEFTRNDRIVFIFSYSYTLLVTVVFVVGTAYMLGVGISDEAWAQFWWYFCMVMLALTCLVTVWVAAGGFKNLKELKQSLEALVRDESDDGTVVGDVSLADLKHDAEGDSK